MDISLSVRIPLVYIASVWIFPQVYQWVFLFFFSFFLLPICRALHLGYLLTDLHVKRKWQIRWFLLSIRKSSSCKETNHVISVGAISFLIYKLKMKLIDYCIDMDSLNDEKKITSTCYISLEHLYFWTSSKQKLRWKSTWIWGPIGYYRTSQLYRIPIRRKLQQLGTEGIFDCR